MDTTFALERPVYFLDEERTEPYLAYGEGVLEPKNTLDVKSSRRAASSAGWQVGEVQLS